MQYHVIRSQTIEVDGPDEGAARRAMESVGTVEEHVLRPMLDDVFSSLVGEDDVVRVDRLTVDLGTMAADGFAEGLVDRLETELRNALPPLIEGARVRGGTTAAPLDAHGGPPAGSVDIRAGPLGAVEEFLETGVMPWYAPAATVGDPERSLRALAESAPGDVRQVVRRIGPRAMTRLVRQFGPPTIGAVVEVLAPGRSTAYVDAIEWWKLHAEQLTRRSPSPTRVWVDSLLWLRSHTGASVEALLDHMLSDAARRAGDAAAELVAADPGPPPAVTSWLERVVAGAGAPPQVGDVGGPTDLRPGAVVGGERAEPMRATGSRPGTDRPPSGEGARAGTAGAPAATASGSTQTDEASVSPPIEDGAEARSSGTVRAARSRDDDAVEPAGVGQGGGDEVRRDAVADTAPVRRLDGRLGAGGRGGELRAGADGVRKSEESWWTSTVGGRDADAGREWDGTRRRSAGGRPGIDGAGGVETGAAARPDRDVDRTAADGVGPGPPAGRGVGGDGPNEAGVDAAGALRPGATSSRDAGAELAPPMVDGDEPGSSPRRRGAVDARRQPTEETAAARGADAAAAVSRRRPGVEDRVGPLDPTVRPPPHDVVGTERAADRGEPRAHRQPRYLEPAGPDEPLYVDNAGLVLIWPFLTRFLEQVGLVADRRFRSEAAQRRAILLLHHVATGSNDCPEQHLVLGKLLCDWPLDEPVERTLEPTPREEGEIERLLTSVIGAWGALGSTSVEGFRSTFLNRDGRLSKQVAGWALYVPRTGFDVLLDRLPWGFGVIALPWMREPVSVEW